MQFVYTCREGANEELRYSIRSVIHFFPDAEIVLVGGKPSWYNGKHIAVPQKSSKYNNVRENIQAIVMSNEVDDIFVYMNDDFYLTNLPDLSVQYNRGSLRSRIDAYGGVALGNIYQQKVINLYNRLLKSKVIDPLDYELHIPILVEKNKLKTASRMHDLWRSFYGNLYLKSNKQIEDPKYYLRYRRGTPLESFIDSRKPFLSSEDESFNYILDQYLKEKFPEKTKHEMD